MMRYLVFLTFVLNGLASVALAEPRIALVVGNSAYETVTTLENAKNDAELISDALEEVGFSVTLLINASQNDLKRGIAEFGRALRMAGPEATGLFYYAGHGVQSFGSNYLLPVDASLTDAADLDLVALEASSVLRQMASARNRSNIVILDACRNNPFETIRELNDNGLAEMNAPTGTFLAYATAPGEVAFDGTGNNSPFTQALARNITVEGRPIEQMMKTVRVEVLEQTNGLQTPWDTSSLVADFAFNPAKPLSAEEVAEQQLWSSVKDSEDSVQIMLFLRSFPNGRYESEARTLLSETIGNELEPAAKPEPEPEPEIANDTTPDLEIALMETAQTSGRLEDYQAYLDAFPEGLFAELVKIEIENLRAQGETAENIETVAIEAPVKEDTLPDVVFFDQPITVGPSELRGLTIGEAAAGEPLFAPIEGIPDELWKEQKCSNCHQWTRDALCTQAQTYTGDDTVRALAKDHPYGGPYKSVLRQWALGGCQ